MIHKLYYFDFPGKAETARLCFTIGKIPFEEVTYDSKTWPQHKAEMPFGQVPALDLPNGQRLAQSGAIDRYVAKLAGLYPEDPVKAALVDQAMCQISDFRDLLPPLLDLPPEERIKTRQEILAGKAKEKLEQLAKVLDTPSGFVAGDSLTVGDVMVFAVLCHQISGIKAGIPPNLLDDYPVLKAFRNRIASVPAIKEYYEKHSDGFRAAYKPDAA